MSESEVDWKQAVAKIRASVLAIVVQSPQTQGECVKILEGLDRLSELRRDAQTSPTEPESFEKPLRNRTKKYKVVRHRGMDFLEERRENSPTPFLVSRTVYETLARVLSEQSESVPVSELRASVDAQLVETVPDYLIRTCLRFWRNEEPRLVTKKGIRYSARDPGAFEKLAAKRFEAAKTP